MSTNSLQAAQAAASINGKSTTTAAVLGFLFGPFGVMYGGGFLHFCAAMVISVFILVISIGFGLIVTIPLNTFWAWYCAKRHNDGLIMAIHEAAPTVV